jgi:hypothetical protein
MLKLHDILLEALTDVVYHFTHPKNLYKILENNEFFLSTALFDTDDVKVNKGRYSYMSLSRTRNNPNFLMDAKIVLDGRKLNQKYKSIPVDYFKNGPKGFEQEDRIISDEINIPNFSKYILSIHINASRGDVPNLNEMIQICNDRNIPIYVYNSVKNFLNQRNPIDPSTINDSIVMFNLDDEFNFEIASLISIDNPSAYEKVIDYLTDFKDIKFQNIYKRMSNGDPKYTMSSNRILVNFMNMQRTPNDDNRLIMKILIPDMKKYKVKDLKDYIDIKLKKIDKKTPE